MSAILDKLLNGRTFTWSSIGEIGEVRMCKRILKEQTTTNGEIPFYKIGTFGKKADAFISRDIFNEYKQKYNYPKKGEILISASGTIGRTVVFDGEDAYFQDSNIVWIEHDESRILNEFLYYVYQNVNWGASEGGTISRLYNENLRKILIPIPPLDVQAEIVRILDAFTAVTAELTAELNMREKQYQYYRDKLLTFSDNEIIWKSLGDLVLPTQNIKWKETLSSYRYIDLSSVDKVNNNIGETLEISSKNAPSRAQKIVKEADIIFATTRPTQMRVAIIPKQFNEQIASTGYCILRANQEEVIPKWIYYNLSLARFKAYLEENQSGVAYPAISDGLVKEFMIPVPSLKEQKRIVEILDKFEALTHSITEGLPKEITLREQQYEYYREQLIDFPKN